MWVPMNFDKINICTNYFQPSGIKVSSIYTDIFDRMLYERVCSVLDIKYNGSKVCANVYQTGSKIAYVCRSISNLYRNRKLTSEALILTISNTACFLEGIFASQRQIFMA